MASFPPLKNYILYCIDQMIKQYHLKSPFLDVGCGTGEASKHLAAMGWHGKAVDLSENAIGQAVQLLSLDPAVKVERMSFFDEHTQFSTILAMDIVEHIDDDITAFKKIHSLLLPGGHLLVTVPSNPREWRWDDDFFGHFRRYTEEEMRQKMTQTGFSVLEIWDFTFPVFWLMRRLYTRLKPAPSHSSHDKMTRTKGSSLARAWEIPLISDLLSKDNILWRALYKWQFDRFRHQLTSGHEIIVLARKN